MFSGPIACHTQEIVNISAIPILTRLFYKGQKFWITSTDAIHDPWRWVDFVDAQCKVQSDDSPKGQALGIGKRKCSSLESNTHVTDVRALLAPESFLPERSSKRFVSFQWCLSSPESYLLSHSHSVAINFLADVQQNYIIEWLCSCRRVYVSLRMQSTQISMSDITCWLSMTKCRRTLSRFPATKSSDRKVKISRGWKRWWVKMLYELQVFFMYPKSCECKWSNILEIMLQIISAITGGTNWCQFMSLLFCTQALKASWDEHIDFTTPFSRYLVSLWQVLTPA